MPHDIAITDTKCLYQHFLQVENHINLHTTRRSQEAEGSTTSGHEEGESRDQETLKSTLVQHALEREREQKWNRRHRTLGSVSVV